MVDSIKKSDTSILIVDDSKDYSNVLSKLLKMKCGYQNITVLDNTEEAWELIKGAPDDYTMLFVDYNFPVGDNGTAFLKKLKEHAFLDGKVSFLITSEPSVKNMEEASRAGAMGVVAKPFDVQELLNQLERAERGLFADSIDYFD